MKNITKVIGVVALVACSGVAFGADTCASPTNLNNAGGSFNLAGNTCNGSSQATLLCANFDYSQKKEIIYNFQLATGFTATSLNLTNVQTGFTPAMFVTSSACASADTCDANGNTSISLSGLTVGTPYFLIVSTTTTAAASNCGTYGLTSDGTLPVKLQKFSVQ